jgi:CRP-like cAMP-binding protein
LFTDRFLRDRRGVELDVQERQVLEKAIFEIRTIDARRTVVQAGEILSVSMLLLEGFMCRYLDDREGMRQLVAVQVPGDFLDLHAYPLKILDHDVASLTAATIAVIPHKALDEIRS